MIFYQLSFLTEFKQRFGEILAVHEHYLRPQTMAFRTEN